jgi:crossover junction endodeoxyribonuclease RusA
MTAPAERPRAVRFTVRGLPAPQGSKRHVGGGRMVESSKAVGPWREAVRAETQREMTWLGRALLGGIVVTLSFYLPRPKGHYGTGRNAGQLKASAPTCPAVAPDLDKLIRAVLDGLTEGGAWRDDGQVVSIAAGKFYADDRVAPGVLIELEEEL